MKRLAGFFRRLARSAKTKNDPSSSGGASAARGDPRIQGRRQRGNLWILGSRFARPRMTGTLDSQMFRERGGRWASALAVAIVALALSVNGAAHAQDTQDPGEHLYYIHGCYGCHGFDGKSRMMMLNTQTSGILTNEETFIAFLRMRAEQSPMLPVTRMPNYPVEALSDGDARAIYAHIVSIQSPDPEIEDIPLLDALLDATGE